MKPRMWIPNPRHVDASNFLRALFSSAIAEGRWQDLWPMLTVLYDLDAQAEPPKRVTQLLRETNGASPLELRQRLESWAEGAGSAVESEFVSVVMPNEARLHDWLRAHVREISEFDGIYTDDTATLLTLARGARIALDVARERARTPDTLPLALIIHGPTGAGKELLAVALHKLSRPTGRSSGFGPVNCGGLPSELIESELFGHVKGAFTGAIEDREGVIASHARGTVFLDEIGDTPPAVQVRLLRFLNDGEVRPVGDDHASRVSPWVIAATHRDLEQRTKAGEFREDLLHRLRGHVLALPPLKARREDILPVLSRCLEHRAGRPLDVHLSEPARQALLTYSWPGNLRELEQLSHSLATTIAGDGRSVFIDLAVLPEIVQTAFSKANVRDQICWLYSDRLQHRREPDTDLRDALLASYAAGLRAGVHPDLNPALLVERVTASRLFAAVAGVDAAIKAHAVAESRRDAAATSLRDNLEARLAQIDGLPIEPRTTITRSAPREDGLPSWVRHFLRLGEEASLTSSQWGTALRQLLVWLDGLSPGAREAAEALFASLLEEVKSQAENEEDDHDPEEPPSHPWDAVRADPVLLGRYLQRYGSAVAMAQAFGVNERTIRDACKQVGIKLPRGGARQKRVKKKTRNRKTTGTRH